MKLVWNSVKFFTIRCKLVPIKLVIKSTYWLNHIQVFGEMLRFTSSHFLIAFSLMTEESNLRFTIVKGISLYSSNGTWFCITPTKEGLTTKFHTIDNIMTGTYPTIALPTLGPHLLSKKVIFYMKETLNNCRRNICNRCKSEVINFITH